MRNIFVAGVALISFIHYADEAISSPVQWFFSSAEFLDGGAIEGSFFFDADTNTYSSISVSTSAGSIFDGAAYSNLNPNLVNGPGSLGIVSALGDLTGASAIRLFFDSSLTNSGGTVGVSLLSQTFQEVLCENSSCSLIDPSQSRTLAAGGEVTTIASPAPITLPGSGLVLLVSLSVLALLRGRRKGAWGP